MKESACLFAVEKNLYLWHPKLVEPALVFVFPDTVASIWVTPDSGGKNQLYTCTVDGNVYARFNPQMIDYVGSGLCGAFKHETGYGFLRSNHRHHLYEFIDGEGNLFSTVKQGRSGITSVSNAGDQIYWQNDGTVFVNPTKPEEIFHVYADHPLLLAHEDKLFVCYVQNGSDHEDIRLVDVGQNAEITRLSSDEYGYPYVAGLYCHQNQAKLLVVGRKHDGPFPGSFLVTSFDTASGLAQELLKIEGVEPRYYGHVNPFLSLPLGELESIEGYQF